MRPLQFEQDECLCLANNNTLDMPPCTTITISTCCTQENDENKRIRILRRVKSAVASRSKISPPARAALYHHMTTTHTDEHQQQQQPWTPQQAQMLQGFQTKMARQLADQPQQSVVKIRIVPKGGSANGQKSSQPPSGTPVRSRSRSRRIQRSKTPTGHNSGRTSSCTGRTSSTSTGRRTQRTPLRSLSRQRNSMEQPPQPVQKEGTNKPTKSSYQRPRPILVPDVTVQQLLENAVQRANHKVVNAHSAPPASGQEGKSRNKSRSRVHSHDGDNGRSRSRSKSRSKSHHDDDQVANEARALTLQHLEEAVQKRIWLMEKAEASKERSRSEDRGRSESRSKRLQEIPIKQDENIKSGQKPTSEFHVNQKSPSRQPSRPREFMDKKDEYRRAPSRGQARGRNRTPTDQEYPTLNVQKRRSTSRLRLAESETGKSQVRPVLVLVRPNDGKDTSSSPKDTHKVCIAPLRRRQGSNRKLDANEGVKVAQFSLRTTR